MTTNHIPVPAAQAALSLLSLSSSSASTPPASHAHEHSSSPSAPTLGRFVHVPRSALSVVRPSPVPGTSHLGTGKRRLSSAVQTRRRTSDAASAAASPALPLRTGASSTASPLTVDAQLSSTLPAAVALDSETTPSGKAKKGTIFKCETCSKVYRHPNCLVKHRWEHSPHWREASKFLLSKHQQVQMLEAAAILSHISPMRNGVGTSLPEDRSLWPAYLSGGLLSTPDNAAPTVVPAHTPLPTDPSVYRERDRSISTSAVDDEDNDNAAMSGESSVEDEDHDREDSGYGSSSAAAAAAPISAVAVPGYRTPQTYNHSTAMSVGGHEYTLSTSHAGCDAGAHMGSMAMGKSFQQSMLGVGRSISSSSFGMSSLRGRDDDDMEEEEESGEGENTPGQGHGGLKWEEDVSMAMDMDL